MYTAEDIFTRIYPGSFIKYLNTDKIEVVQVSYDWPASYETSDFSIIINRASKSGKEIYIESVDDKIYVSGIESSENHFEILSSPNETLSAIWNNCRFSDLSKIMSFIGELKAKNFSKFILNRWEKFEYYRSEDPRQFLINYIDAAFDRELQHCIYCERKLIFDGEHVCDGTSHLRCLLRIAFDKNIIIHETKNNCLGAVVFLSEDLQYIHITPNGSFIVGTSGQGTCRHPLTRLIFWKCLISTRPEYSAIFNKHYHYFLSKDLKDFNFIISEFELSIDEMISHFNISRCLMCGNAGHTINRKIRSWDHHSTYNSKSCQCNSFYNYHLILLGVLKNRWMGDDNYGRMVLDCYGGQKKIKFEAGNVLTFDGDIDYCHFIRGDFSIFLSNMITKQ